MNVIRSASLSGTVYKVNPVDVWVAKTVDGESQEFTQRQWPATNPKTTGCLRAQKQVNMRHTMGMKFKTLKFNPSERHSRWALRGNPVF